MIERSKEITKKSRLIFETQLKSALNYNDLTRSKNHAQKDGLDLIWIDFQRLFLINSNVSGKGLALSWGKLDLT